MQDFLVYQPLVRLDGMDVQSFETPPPTYSGCLVHEASIHHDVRRKTGNHMLRPQATLPE